MARRRAAVVRVALAALLAGAAGVVCAQAPLPPPPPLPPVRDVPPPAREPAQPAGRTIPIGSGSISGVVTAADSGRPVKGAMINVSGTVAAPPRTGAPIPGIAPELYPAAFGGPNFTVFNRTTVTDARGQFTMGRLPPGRYTVMVTAEGYLSTMSGAKRPGGRGIPIALADNQQLQISIPMVRGGVITGVVLDETGAPETNAQVRLLRINATSGVKRLQPMNGALTDDRGVYRLHGLMPGDYVVSATANPFELSAERVIHEAQALEAAIQSGRVNQPPGPGLPSTVVVSAPTPPGQPQAPPAYLPTFHPSVPNAAQSTIIRVTGGDEHAGVDVVTRPVRAGSVHGWIASALPEGAAVQIALASNDPMTGTPPQTRTQPDGRFVIGNVAPGNYMLTAWTVPAPNRVQVNIAPDTPGTPNALAAVGAKLSPTPQFDESQRLWARMPLTIDGPEPVVVSVSLQPGRSISGRVIFEMATQPDLSRRPFMVSLTPGPLTVAPASPTPQPAPVAADGSFVLTGVLPGTYVLRTIGAVKSSMVHGQDTLDVPFEVTGEEDITGALITVTDKVSELSGALTDAAGRTAYNYSILAVTTDRRFWTPSSRRVAMTQIGADGRYVFRNLPPGDYMIAAVADLEPGDQYDPEFLQSITGASLRVTIGEGAKVTQDLRVR